MIPLSLTAAQRAMIREAVDNKAREEAASRGQADANKVGRKRVTMHRVLPEELLHPIEPQDVIQSPPESPT